MTSYPTHRDPSEIEWTQPVRNQWVRGYDLVRLTAGSYYAFRYVSNNGKPSGYRYVSCRRTLEEAKSSLTEIKT